MLLVNYAYLDDHGRYRLKPMFDLGNSKAGDASHPVRMIQPSAGQKMRWYSVLFGLLFTLNAIAETKPAPPLECGDFLKQLGLQRPEIKYISCTRTNSHEPGMDGLTATYQVAGKDIAKVETWLIRFAHVKPLKFNCCGWETNDVTFKGKDDAQYTIGMGGETTESSRKNFSKIPYLTLYVSHYFYEP